MSEIEQGCDCAQCVAVHASTDWDKLMSGRLRCPECGAHIFAHFQATHMLWHVHRLDLTAETHLAWRATLGLV